MLKEENEKQVNDEEKVRAIKQILEKNAWARNAKLAVKRKAKNPIKIKREGGEETNHNNI